ncbi:MAG: IS66 family transposase [Thermoplasmataceae archaeon]
MDKTPDRCPDHKKIIDDLSKKIEEQEKIIEELRKNYEKLKKDFDEYRVRHPENVGIKNGKPYYYMPETAAADQNSTESQSEPKPEKKRSGARIGHRGYHRPVPDHVDEERTVSITQCPYCWSDLSDTPATRTRTIEGIPEIKPTVIRYTIERRYCSRCKKQVEPEFREALPKATLSLRTMLVIAYMKTVERLPAARVSDMMRDIFNFHVTKGEVMHIIHQLSIHLGSAYRNLVGRIRKAKSRYIDETSWRVDGKNRYMWVFVTEGESLYITGSRSHEVPEKVLGKHDGVDMHDGFSGYVKLAKITKNRQAWCWAHIMKDAKELIEYNESEGKYILNILKSVFDRAKKLLEKPPEEISEEMLKALYDEFRQIDVPYESKKCSGFVRNQLKRKRDDIFRFVIDRSVEPTNNRAERAIRPIVICRKISGGSRSVRGARDFTRVYSVLESCRKRGKLPFRAKPG